MHAVRKWSAREKWMAKKKKELYEDGEEKNHKRQNCTLSRHLCVCERVKRKRKIRKERQAYFHCICTVVKIKRKLHNLRFFMSLCVCMFGALWESCWKSDGKKYNTTLQTKVLQVNTHTPRGWERKRARWRMLRKQQQAKWQMKRRLQMKWRIHKMSYTMYIYTVFSFCTKKGTAPWLQPQVNGALSGSVLTKTRWRWWWPNL